MTHEERPEHAPGLAPASSEADADEERLETALVPRDRSLVEVDPFRRYLAEVRKYPALDRGEELELARRYRETGDRDALFRLVTSNLMLVVRVALSFRRIAQKVMDLIGEGNLGLLQAIDRFDPGLGVRLPTYAHYWIRAYMIKFLLDNVRQVRVGTTNARRKLLRNLRKEKEKLENEGFEVTPKLLAERFGVSEEDVVDVEQAIGSRDVSLDAPLTAESEQRTHGDLLPAGGQDVEQEVAERQLRERAQEAIGRFRATLAERDRAILDDRILSEDPQTLQMLGDRFEITREAVRQAEARLMTRLKDHLREELGDAAKVRVDRE